MSFYQTSLIFLATLLPTYLIRFSVLGIPTNLLEVALWAVALVGVTRSDVRHSWHVAAKTLPKPVFFSVFLFVISAVLSTAISPHLETSLGILKGWIVTPMIFGFMVYASTHYSLRITRYILRALILSGLVVALLGISQLGQLERIRGPYDVSNSLALFLAPFIVLAIFSASTADPPKWRANSKFSLLAAGVMFLALLFTQSLSGVLVVTLTLLIGLIVFHQKFQFLFSLPREALAKWGNFYFLILAIAITILSAAVLLPKTQYLVQPASSAHVRLQLWSISWELIQEHPLLGIGLGTFEPAYQQKLHERFLQPTHYNLQPIPEFVFRDPHNWLLSFWLNTGLIGLISFAALNFWTLRRGFKNQNWGVALALLALLVFGLADTIFWKNDLAAFHWLLIALLLTSQKTALLPLPQTGG